MLAIKSFGNIVAVLLFPSLFPGFFLSSHAETISRCRSSEATVWQVKDPRVVFEKFNPHRRNLKTWREKIWQTLIALYATESLKKGSRFDRRSVQAHLRQAYFLKAGISPRGRIQDGYLLYSIDQPEDPGALYLEVKYFPQSDRLTLISKTGVDRGVTADFKTEWQINTTETDFFRAERASVEASPLKLVQEIITQKISAGGDDQIRLMAQFYLNQIVVVEQEHFALALRFGLHVIDNPAEGFWFEKTTRFGAERVWLSIQSLRSGSVMKTFLIRAKVLFQEINPNDFSSHTQAQVSIREISPQLQAFIGSNKPIDFSSARLFQNQTIKSALGPGNWNRK